MKSFKVKCPHACTGHICLLYIAPTKRLNLLVMDISQQQKVYNFQRFAQDDHLIFQNEANFSCIEAYLTTKIFKFGKASWSSFPLRALTSKISLRVAAWATQNQYPSDASNT